MTVPGNLSSPLLATAAAAAAGVNITKSVRLNSGDSAHLTRTPSSSGNRKTFTWAGWVKRSSVATSDQGIFGSTSGATFLRFKSNQLDFVVNGATHRRTSQVFRDNSSWYHFVWAVDTTQATASNRSRFYVNGVEVTDWGTDNALTQDSLTGVNNAVAHVIGATDVVPNDKLDAYLGDFYLIDGSQLEPTSFGAFDDSGVWQAAAYSGTYPDNSFHLFDFANESTVGHDSSGNNNDWTANNISTTAGAGNDVLFDVPVNGDASNDTGAGGELSSNYCTFNPLITTGGNSGTSSAVLSQGNMKSTNPASNSWNVETGTIAVKSGKWYYEYTVSGTVTNFLGGWADPQEVNYNDAVGNTARSYGYYNTGNVRNGNGNTSFGSSYTAGDVIGCAIDIDNQKIYWSKNGTFQNSADPAAGTGSIYTIQDPVANNFFYTIAVSTYDSSQSVDINTGQRAFAYTAPSGFKALCTANLPTPTIADGSNYFEAKAYTGNGSTQSISDFEFSPDFVWLKSRDDGEHHGLFDTQRGALYRLVSDYPYASTLRANTVTSFNSDGFSLGSAGEYNGLNEAHIAWAWDAGTSNASNTDGDVTSTVRANIAAGFSIVTWTGVSQTNLEIGHGLGAEPYFIAVKKTNLATDWVVYHKSIGNTHYLRLNGTLAATDSTVWGDTTPTSSVFTVNASDTGTGTDDTYIAYCFAPVAGFSAIGKFVSNNSTDNVFVYTGFRPRFLLWKKIDDTGSWGIYDAARNPFNAVDKVLLADSANAESTLSTPPLDFLSNGFKVRDTLGTSNSLAYICFAENPFQANGGLAR